MVTFFDGISVLDARFVGFIVTPMVLHVYVKKTRSSLELRICEIRRVRFCDHIDLKCFLCWQLEESKHTFTVYTVLSKPFHSVSMKIKYAFISFHPDKTCYVHFVMAATITNKYCADNGSDDDEDSDRDCFFRIVRTHFCFASSSFFSYIISVVARIVKK